MTDKTQVSKLAPFRGDLKIFSKGTRPQIPLEALVGIAIPLQKPPFLVERVKISPNLSSEPERFHNH